MLLSQKDKNILKYIEKYNVGITIKQASKMFFPKNQHNYDYARTKLKTLHDRQHLKYHTNDITNEYIYYTDRTPNSFLTHDTFSMNVYINLLYYGANILYFNRNEVWKDDILDNEIRSDGFIIYQFGDKTKAIIIECDIYHDTKDTVKKYEKLFKTNLLQEQYGDFPLLIVMNKIKKNHCSDNFTIINMDLNCNDFVGKVLSL